LEKNLSKSNVEIEDNFSINGNLKFKTNAELGELSELQNYNYDFNINYNSKEEIMKFTLGMNDKEKDIIHANLYQIKEKQYIELPKLFEYLLEIDTSDYDNTLNQTEWNYDSEDIKIIIQKIKDAFLNSLDESYIEREKTARTILKRGWIELNEETIKHYLDGFALSYRNGLFYENLGVADYHTSYDIKDYHNFLFGDDSQIRREGKEYLGYQMQVLKNRDFKF